MLGRSLICKWLKLKYISDLDKVHFHIWDFLCLFYTRKSYLRPLQTSFNLGINSYFKGPILLSLCRGFRSQEFGFLVMKVQCLLSLGFQRRWGKKHKSTSENKQGSRTSGMDYSGEMLKQREQFSYGFFNDIWALAATPMALFSSSWGMRYRLVSGKEKPLLTRLLL